MPDIDVQRKRIRNFYIRVLPPHGHVVVSAPHGASQNAIEKLLIDRADWVRKQQQRIAEREHAYPTAPPVEDGSQHVFEGRNVALALYEAPGPVTMKLQGQALFLQVPHGTTEQGRRQALEQMYRQALKDRLPSLIAAWEPIMGVKVAEWRLKQMKHLWGSCNTHARRIWLNPELIRRPPASLEFVLVHEMTHLLERGHNQRFYRLMDRFMPDWRERRRGLYARIIEG